MSQARAPDLNQRSRTPYIADEEATLDLRHPQIADISITNS